MVRWTIVPERLAGQEEAKVPSRRVGKIPASVGMELCGGEISTDRGEEFYKTSYRVED